MIERKACPDCGGELGKSATKCRCGWKGAPKYEPAPAPVLTVDYGALERERARMRRWEEAGSPPASESIAKMRALAAKPRPSPREHWERVLQTPVWCAPMLALEYARAALRRSSEEPMPQTMREPGQDDEERSAEPT